MSVTYDGLVLPNVEPLDEVDVGVVAGEVRLYSGKTYVYTSMETRFKARLRGTTNSKADIAALIGKVGRKASLVVDGDTYTKCSITSLRWGWQTSTGSHYWYEVEFTQETA